MSAVSRCREDLPDRGQLAAPFSSGTAGSSGGAGNSLCPEGALDLEDREDRGAMRKDQSKRERSSAANPNRAAAHLRPLDQSDREDVEKASAGLSEDASKGGFVERVERGSGELSRAVQRRKRETAQVYRTLSRFPVPHKENNFNGCRRTCQPFTIKKVHYFVKDHKVVAIIKTKTSKFQISR